METFFLLLEGLLTLIFAFIVILVFVSWMEVLFVSVPRIGALIRRFDLSDAPKVNYEELSLRETLRDAMKLTSWFILGGLILFLVQTFLIH